jgi:AcrR family transcriptional regulator
MGHVARHAGVAVGSLYLRAPTKEALLARVLEDVEQELAEVMERAAADGHAWPKRIEAVFRALLEATASMPDLPHLMRLAHHAAASRAPHPGPIRLWIAKFIRAGQSAGALRLLDAELSAAIAFGMVEGAMGAHALDPALGQAAVVEALTDLVTRWLLVESAPAVTPQPAPTHPTGRRPARSR